MELRTHLVISERLGYLTHENYGEFRAATESIGKMLNALIVALRRRASSRISTAPNPQPPTPNSTRMA
jgi:hypothetical protein